MKVTLYGVRGSLPTPLTQVEFMTKMKILLEEARKQWISSPDTFSTESFLAQSNQNSYIGGNTTCIFIEGKNDEKVIIDFGSGARKLGNDLLAKGIAKGGNLIALMTHTHWDHIQGFPFFKPAFIPSVHIDFYSTIPNLEERFIRQQHSENFPLPFQEMQSHKNFHHMNPGETFRAGSLEITPFLMRHPGSSTGYRIADGTHSMFFCSDVEIQDGHLEEFEDIRRDMGEPDILIIDAQYGTDEAKQKLGWGHTSGRNAIECGKILGAKKVFLTHHEPDHREEQIYDLFEAALSEHPNTLELEVHLAREEMVIEL